MDRSTPPPPPRPGRLAYYRLQPLNPAGVTFDATVNARTATPPVVGGRLTIVGTNVLNYFTTLDMAPFRSTPPYDGGSNTPRGADTAIEFTRQQAKIVAMLAGMHADVFGLTEIEAWDGANAGLGAGQALVDALNAVVGAGTYAVIADPVLGHFDPLTDLDSDYIQNVIIYNTLTVTPVGASMSVDDIIFDRSPFAQEFEEISSGEQFVVVVNHFKSKGSCPAAGDPNADQGDGQGCWSLKREQQAAALLTFINYLVGSAGSGCAGDGRLECLRCGRTDCGPHHRRPGQPDCRQRAGRRALFLCL